MRTLPFTLWTYQVATMGRLSWFHPAPFMPDPGWYSLGHEPGRWIAHHADGEGRAA